MEPISIGLGIVIGGLLTGISVFAYLGRKAARDAEAIRRLEEQRSGLDQELAEVRTQAASFDRQVAELETRLDEQQKRSGEIRERMVETFAKISQATVDSNSKTFLQLATTKFEPFKEMLNKTQTAVQELETKRVKAYTELQEATRQIITVNNRSEEHTSELQSRSDLVCRLLLAKKKKKKIQ